jgi:hypothetical protein
VIERLARLWRCALKLNARQVESILHARDVVFLCAPPVSIDRRAIVGGKMAVELRQDTGVDPSGSWWLGL